MTDKHDSLDEPAYGAMQRSMEVARAQQKATAVELRAQGHTYAEIGEAMDLSTSAAATLVKQALDDTVREPAEQLRQIEAMRIEKLWRVAWPKANVEHFRGPFGAMDTQGEWFDRLVKLMERRAKLLGLDSAAEISFPELRVVLFAMMREQLPPEEYQKLVAQLAE